MSTTKREHMPAVMALVLTVTLAGLFGVGVSTLSADNYYVVPAGTPGVIATAPYTNWATAGTSVVEVVNAAMARPEPRTVFVSNGTHVLTSQIVITNALTLCSIAGHGPDDTIINGGYAAGGPTTNRCLFMNSSGAFVHGLTISNGACISAAYDGGGGVRMLGGVLSNCTVCANTVFIYGNWYEDGGGGVYMTGNSAVRNCRIVGNAVSAVGATPVNPAGLGGGVYEYGASCVIQGCVISNNYFTTTVGKSFYGAGVYMGASSRIESSLVCNNAGPTGNSTTYGGVYLNSGSMLSCTSTANYGSTGMGCFCAAGLIDNSLFSANSAGTSGGAGVFMQNGLLCNSTIANNNKNWANLTGALQFSGGSAYNCVISSNGTDYGVLLTTANSALSNCTVKANVTGIACRKGSVLNCLVARNGGYGMMVDTGCVSACTIAQNKGTGVRIQLPVPSSLSFSSCIIYSNGTAGADDVFDAASPVNSGVLQYSCLGVNPGFTGDGIKVANPRFKNAAGDDYRLSGVSPCINAGSNELWMATMPDLAGGKRIRGGTVDMGAYEYLYRGSVVAIY
ncbi:MAG: right-handed parallel beta-helix repeat-containing protein [Kiritimatiellae bacterium]|nr:right-handed parallel beta-helix repeat-containing protein [Kiritimatiellia bacterium]